MIDLETTLLQQLLNIAQRERIAKIPPDRTKDDAGFGLPPFEDRRSGYHFAIVSRHQPATPKVATPPFGKILHPTPNCGVVDVETTLLQQLLNLAQRERIAQIPPDGTKDDAGFGVRSAAI